ncbi:alternative ribosome rescue aminoacyl-tRNA hydrolase ArfB [Christiangramia sabulilitoris]|uniref:Aminoacyl-tRNA hydrolase n=1 Tax=Christiangramia sabulilitoris TaxID=2583991 RepID=A0A550I875_9FLAO|nr:alternative ribosome rescue aminoacyl-tRNA hydrolase ArfB [Christiangramia sabulilitoris]TRO67175.1 aminoacyl-tRNA hydrolase [Christiangramia sabulilitoris]
MNEEVLFKELDYKAVRSSGPGGQHANKTSTKVELSFDVENSEGLSNEEKILIQKKLAARINKEGILKLTNEDSRSQHSNKEIVTRIFISEVRQALKKPRLRKKTRPTRASKIKRLKAKKQKSEIKANRKNPLK